MLKVVPMGTSMAMGTSGYGTTAGLDGFLEQRNEAEQDGGAAHEI